MGASAALITGGHGTGDPVLDLLVTADEEYAFAHPRVDTAATHGSGCTLSSAVAARMARGAGVVSAVETATDALQRAVRYPLDVGGGPGAVHHAVGIRERAARDPTLEAVEDLLAAVVDTPGIRRLVPEVGTNVVGATPYAERPAEVAAVEGRLSRSVSGVRTTRGVRFGASSHLARFLLSAREFDPDLRFAVNVRFDEAVESALDAVD